MIMEIQYGSEYRKPFEDGERWVGQYLDKYFYPNICVAFERNEDTETQKRGIDLSLTGNTQVIKIDEKATITYVHTDLQTYALEIDLLNQYFKVNDSWLINDTLNTHLGLIWIDDAETRNGRYLTGSGITDCTVAIISKQKIHEYLESKGWTKQLLKRKAERIRKAFIEHEEDYWKYERCGKINEDGLHFFIQVKQPEKAVCVQLSRDKLIELSDYTARIRNNKIKILHNEKRLQTCKE